MSLNLSEKVIEALVEGMKRPCLEVFAGATMVSKDATPVRFFSSPFTPPTRAEIIAKGNALYEEGRSSRSMVLRLESLLREMEERE